MKILVWLPRIIIGVLLAIILFVTIPSYVPYQACSLPPRPYLIVLGFPWQGEPCNYGGLVWGKPLLFRLAQLRCILVNGGICP